MAVFPLLMPANGGPEYITLKEALERGVFAVTEVSEGGSVPELKVENKGQVAVLFLDGKAVGFDFVSRPAAFGLLYSKLVKSYVMEAMLASERRKARDGKRGEKEKGGARPAVTGPAPDEARAFLAAATACEEKKQESVGMGWYFRYSGKEMVGSALAVEEKIVHMAFFSVEEAEKAGPMAGMRSRRGYRTI
jgi:hypothetical protein